MNEMVLLEEASERWVRGRPSFGWMDVAKVDLGSRGMTMRAAQQLTKDRDEWRAPVNMHVIV